MTLPSGIAPSRTTFRPIAPKPGSCRQGTAGSDFISLSSVVERSLYYPTISNTLLQTKGIQGSWNLAPARMSTVAPPTTPTASLVRSQTPAHVLVSRQMAKPSALPAKTRDTATPSYSSPRVDFPNPAAVVEFSSYEKLVSPSNPTVGSQRAAYAAVVVPEKRLAVTSKNYLRLFDLVPKARNCDGGADVNAVEAAAIGRKNSLTKVTSGPYRSGGAARKTSASLSHSPRLDEFSLRPSARLLTRLGQCLVRHQYSRFERCQAGDSEKTTATADGGSVTSQAPSGAYQEGESQCTEQPDPLAGHIVWQRKELTGRWISMKDLCEERLCPFVPPSALAMHRHLEVGHARLFSVIALSRSEPAAQPEEVSCSGGGTRTGYRVKSDPPPVGRTAKGITGDIAAGRDVSNPFLVSLQPSSVLGGSQVQTRFQCPVCPRCKPSHKAFMGHCARHHPFLTIQPVTRGVKSICNVCGFVSGRLRQLRANLLVHYRCQLNVSTYRNLPWSNQDVPTLACFILFPNQRSRFYLPETMALHLVKTLDQVLSVHVGRLHLWSLNSLALRSVLAVSSLYAEVVDSASVSLQDNAVVSFRPVDDKAGASKTQQKVSIICCPPVEATINITTVTVTTTAVASMPLQTSCSSSTATNTSTTNTTATIISISSAAGGGSGVGSCTATRVNANTRKRVYPTSLDDQVSSAKRPAVSGSSSPHRSDACPTDTSTKDSNHVIPAPSGDSDDGQSTSCRQSPNQASQTVVLDDNGDDYDGNEEEVQEKDVSEATTRQCRLARRTSRSLGERSAPQRSKFLRRSAWLRAYLARQQQSESSEPPVNAPQGSSLMSMRPCELCNTQIATSGFHQRMHMISSHRVKCGYLPGEHCYYCGQLFWTTAGRDAHANVACSVCLTENVCQSTLYTHMILSHNKELLASMQELPAICLLCEKLFPTTTRLVWHLFTEHCFRCPLENFTRNHRTGKPLRWDSCDTAFPSTHLHDFDKFAGLVNTEAAAGGCRHRADLQHLLTPLPSNIAVQPVKAGATRLPMACFRCSVCACLFVSVPHLDLHVMQAGHHYACPECNYSSQCGSVLCAHYAKVHQGTASSSSSTGAAPPTTCSQSSSSFRLWKVLNGPAGVVQSVTSSSSTIGAASLVDTHVTSSSPWPLAGRLDELAPESSPVNPLSRMHRCDKCPVFCLTLEDLRIHQSSAHTVANSGAVASSTAAPLAQPKVMLLPVSQSRAMPALAPKVTATVIQQRPFSRTHLMPVSAYAGYAAAHSVANQLGTVSFTSVLARNRPLMTPSVVAPSPPPLPASRRNPARSQSSSSSGEAAVTSRDHRRLTRLAESRSTTASVEPKRSPEQRTTGEPSSSTASVDMMIMCPMCEFQSTERSVVLLHVASVHGQ